jgi:hypothetical protein
MSLKAYLWGLKFSTFLALAAWGLIVFYVDPEKSGLEGQAFFYSSLFLALAGFFTLFFTLVRKKVVDEEEQLFHVGMSLRQGLLLALLAVILLMMQHFRVLVWWDGLLVVAGTLLAELYFLSR